MANDAAKSPKKTESKEKSAKKSKLPLIIVMAMMLGEGAAIFFVAKIVFGPSPLDPAAAAEVAASSDEIVDAKEEAPAVEKTAEVDIADCRPSNKATGKLITYRLRVSALVRKEDAEKIAALVESNRARIEDRVNFVIRSAEPRHLEEPGLDTIKRRVKRELDRILGDEQLILEILIPELLQA